MSEEIHQCPLCGSSHIIKEFKRIQDYAVSQESFTIDQCQNCDLIFTNPRPEKQDIAPYYEFEEYYSHSDGGDDLVSKIYQGVKARNIRSKLKDLEFLHGAPGKWLDYGCGTAELINQGKMAGWEVSGIEPNSNAFSLANTKLPGQIFQTLDDCSETSFDIISLYHVLEHIHDIRETIKELLNKLKSRGHLIIAVPNPLSPDSNKYQDQWAGWDVPRHLYHFPSSTMEEFGKIFSLDLIRIQPMLFDSFYVSLLSESYQNPNQSNISKYLSAFYSGLWSNIKASSDSNFEHSSNIYYFRKP